MAPGFGSSRPAGSGSFGSGFSPTGNRRPPKIQIDQKALNAFFTTDPGAQMKLGLIALEFMSATRQAAPMGTSAPWGKFKAQHGMYKRSLHVRKFRGGYRVYSSDPFAHLVEYGSANNPTYAPMRRALRAVAAGRAVIHPAGTVEKTGDNVTSRSVEGQHTL